MSSPLTLNDPPQLTRFVVGELPGASVKLYLRHRNALLPPAGTGRGELARLSHSFETQVRSRMLSFNPDACRCCCTVATDMTRWWASCRCRRISSEETVRALSRRMLAII